MLHIWMEQNVVFYGMIGAGILGILCMFMVDRFYGRAIRDVRRITEPKGKWTKEFLNQYQMRLTKEQEEYPLGSILRLTEGNLAPVACLETEENACERCGVCPTLDFWTGLYAAVNEYVDRFTLADLVREELEKQGRASRPSTD